MIKVFINASNRYVFLLTSTYFLKPNFRCIVFGQVAISFMKYVEGYIGTLNYFNK